MFAAASAMEGGCDPRPGAPEVERGVMVAELEAASDAKARRSVRGMLAERQRLP